MAAQILTRLTFIALLFCLSCTTQSKPAVKLSEAATIASSFDSATRSLVVKVALKDGVHAYAPGEQTGKPVSLVVSGANGWKVVGDVEIPKGKEKVLRSSGKSLILEGTFSLRAKVEGGQGPIEGELHLQVCSDEGCDRPRIHGFTAEVPKSS